MPALLFIQKFNVLPHCISHIYIQAGLILFSWMASWALDEPFKAIISSSQGPDLSYWFSINLLFHWCWSRTWIQNICLGFKLGRIVHSAMYFHFQLMLSKYSMEPTSGFQFARAQKGDWFLKSLSMANLCMYRSNEILAESTKVISRYSGLG